jgi:hypothetical protein
MNNRVAGTLWTVAVVLLVLWLAGLIAGSTFGGLIHILLVLIVLAVIISIIPRRG